MLRIKSRKGSTPSWMLPSVFTKLLREGKDYTQQNKESARWGQALKLSVGAWPQS